MKKMRKNTKNIILGTIICMIVLTSFNNGKIVKAQEYSYSSLLVPDTIYEWDVTTLVTTGMDIIDLVDYAGESLIQGDKLAAKILLNVNDTAMGYPINLTDVDNVWVEFYLNGDNVTTNVRTIKVQRCTAIRFAAS